VYRHKVHVGYLAAIVAASNAGGSGSVVGDTTTTMMWISGVSPFAVVHAYVAAVVALLVFGVPASLQQQRHSPIVRQASGRTRVDWVRVGVVGVILAAAVATNVTINVAFPSLATRFPFIGASVWVALFLTAPLRTPDWKVLRPTLRGTAFLLCLVFAATLMPIDALPSPSWRAALGLGFVSAVFDNIPLTKLALEQGGYDWGMLAYAVGFGGSMIWFGSSAGVAVTNAFPQARSVGLWLRSGWHVALGYVAGFVALLFTLGWQPHS
jgi:Na+/H+ antiporter NhaD/arsenite permease-like protein